MPPQILSISDSYDSGFSYWNTATQGTAFDRNVPPNNWFETPPTQNGVGLWNFEVVGFQIAKQDSTRSDPLTVTLTDPAWTEFATVPARNVPGYTGPVAANSFLATRWFSRQRTYATAPVYPAGTMPSSCRYVGSWSGFFGVISQVNDVYVGTTTSGVVTNYTFTPSVTGLCASHFLSGANANMTAVPCTAGTPLTVTGGGGFTHDFVVLTLQAATGWGVNTISW